MTVKQTLLNNDAGIQRHAVMVRWQDHGLLICGPPGIGKSSLALAILNLGGQFIADDSVDIYRQNEQLIARCPANALGLLHSRELGMLDITALFGPAAVVTSAPVTAVIELRPAPSETVSFNPQQSIDLLGIKLPMLALSVSNPLSLTERIAIWLRQQQLPEAKSNFIDLQHPPAKS